MLSQLSTVAPRGKSLAPWMNGIIYLLPEPVEPLQSVE